MSHTPGPWRIEKPRPDVIEVKGGDGYYVAAVSARDAALVAAAPELYEEAMNRMHYSDNPRTVLHSWSESEPLTDIGGVCGLCAAIAKARGER